MVSIDSSFLSNLYSLLSHPGTTGGLHVFSSLPPSPAAAAAAAAAAVSAPYRIFNSHAKNVQATIFIFAMLIVQVWEIIYTDLLVTLTLTGDLDLRHFACHRDSDKTIHSIAPIFGTNIALIMDKN